MRRLLVLVFLHSLFVSVTSEASWVRLEREVFCAKETIRADLGAFLVPFRGRFASAGIWLRDIRSGNALAKIDISGQVENEEGFYLHSWEDVIFEFAKEMDKFEEMVPVIGCRKLNNPWEEPGCFGNPWPKLVEVSATPHEHDGTVFKIRFDRDTDEPAVDNFKKISSLLSFSEDIGANATGKWESPRVMFVHSPKQEFSFRNTSLVLSLVLRKRHEREKDFESLSSFLAANEHQSKKFAGNLHLQLDFTISHFQLELYGLDDSKPLAKSSVFRLEEDSCKPIWRISSLAHLEKASWSMKERIVLEKTALLLPPISATFSEWTIAFWILLPHNIQSAGYKALIFHGDGNGPSGGRRTPSLWFHESKKTFALRVSTVSAIDFGLDSNVEVKEGEWNHLALTLQNSSRFSAKLFVNGLKDLELTMPAGEVLPPVGRLRFGHDPFNSGPRVVLQDLKTLHKSINRHDVLQMIERTRPLLQTFESGETNCSVPIDESMNEELVLEAASLSGKYFDPRKIGLLQSAVAGCNGEAAFELAFEREPHDRWELLEKAKKFGSVDATFVLAIRHWMMSFFNPSANIGKIDLNMLEFAALEGSTEAKLVLAERLRMSGSCRASNSYLASVAKTAFLEHSAGGKQSIIESQELHDYIEKSGEMGESDEQLQFMIHQAERGDANALHFMGSVFYWGIRGMQRDQQRAFSHFSKAASFGHIGAMTATGNMLVNGEGVSRNVTKALQLYERAARHDNLEALNGLGYVFYVGNGDIEKNVTKALEYFERNARDGDSLFNAAFIYLNEDSLKDTEKAVSYLRKASDKFESFMASFTLGNMLLEEDGSHVSCREANKYLRKAALRGTWSKVLRRGFDNFLEDKLDESLFHYLQAALMGYSRGAENAIWLLHQLGRLQQSPFQMLYSLVEAPVPPLQRLFLGDIAFEEGRRNDAISHWIKASVEGDTSHQIVFRSQASYNLAIESMREGKWERSGRYLKRAKNQLQNEKSSEHLQAARFALVLAEWRLWAAKSFDLHLLQALLVPSSLDIA